MCPPSVVVAVSPKLLSDTVRRTLQLDGIVTSEAGELLGPADIAIVTSGREVDVDAEAVITLTSDGPGARDAEAPPPVDAGTARVVDLAQLRATLATILPRSGD